MHDVDRRVLDLATRQRGAFSRAQVLEAGGDRALLRRRLIDGRWLQVEQGVYELAGLPPDRERPLWIAWLAIGPHAVVSHETAALRNGLGPILTRRLTFTSGHGDHHRIAGVTVHQLKDLLPHHHALLDGLPTTTVPRTIVDLAAVSSRVRLERVVEGAVHDERTTEAAIGAVLWEIARRGKRGVRNLTAVLDARAPGDGLSESVLERMLLGALRDAGLPPPIPQFPHPGRTPGRSRVDFAYPEARLILEADGRRWHQRMADLKRDRARDNDAARAGWLTLRFMWEELRNDPLDVARTVAEARLHRLAA